MAAAGAAKKRKAGRPKGRRNNKTLLREIISQDGVTPLTVLLAIMRNEKATDSERLEAAKAAAPYVHPKLISQHTTQNTGGLSHEDWLASLEDDDERPAGNGADPAAEGSGEGMDGGTDQEGTGLTETPEG